MRSKRKGKVEKERESGAGYIAGQIIDTLRKQATTSPLPLVG